MFTTKRGRPRTQGVARCPSGQIKPEAITATAEEARIRQLLGVDMWQAVRRDEKTLQAARKRVSNPLLGYALGRFLYAGEIDQKQHDAGLWFAELYRDMAYIRGWPVPNIRALDYGAVAGRSTADGMKDHIIERRREEWEKTMAKINAANGDRGKSIGPIMEILKRVLVEDIGPSNAYELGNLRIGLNAINQARGV